MNFNWQFLSIDEIQEVISSTINEGYNDFFQYMIKFTLREMAERMLGLNERLTDRIIIQVSPERTIEGICATIKHEVMHAVLYEIGEVTASNVLDKIIFFDLEFFDMMGGAVV